MKETLSSSDHAGELRRQKDLLIQVERFLRYAPKGTSKTVLEKEARQFEARLEAVRGAFGSKSRELQRRLRTLRGAELS